ncbi:MAG: septum formation protein Maf [Candidatus Omnitrophica bacterium]|nr:septum formation protein Maf [Candidatus Omnitrophota bacterium]MBU4488215.1 septum formation protein Maf [Candidatus Omnitrophota bacterium]MCG2705382.1 Maf family nucleotide pyrophosphatase [Candidatus Omnitrophota bacterium]
MKKIILASQSKRRSAILTSCGISHKVIPSGVREMHKSSGGPEALVMHNARIKAEQVAKGRRSGIILGVDTMVLFKGKLMGKPADKDAAKKMLRSFSGKRLLVYSGLHLIDTASGRSSTGFDITALRIKRILRRDIEKYFKLLGPYDKAGGFSIEGIGSIVFDDIKGSYYNVLGLPMAKLQELFQKIGLDLLDFVK